jgi:hypothetical protein
LHSHLGEKPGVVSETLFGSKSLTAPNAETFHGLGAAADLVLLRAAEDPLGAGQMVEYHDVGRQRAGMRERFPEIVHLVLAELEIDNIAAYWDILEVGAHNIHGSVHAPRRPFARKVIKAARILPKLSVIDSHG